MRAHLGWLGLTLAACGSPAAPPTSAPPPSTEVTPTPTPAPSAVAPVAPPTSAPVVSAAIAPHGPRVRVEGFDLRATFWNSPLFVLSRSPAGAVEDDGEALGDETEMDTLHRWILGPASGDPVRVVGEHGVCDGTLGERVRIEAPWLDTGSSERAAIGHQVTGCPGPALFAIVRPTPDAPWPTELGEDDAAGTRARAAACAAATALAAGASESDFASRAVRLEDVTYGLAWGPRCDGDDDGEERCTAAGSAVVSIRGDAEPRTEIVRPVHFPWEEPTDAGYVPCGIMDVDGDGSIELCEQMTSDQGSMLRLVRPAERRAGEMIWSVEEVAEYTLPRGGTTPAPLASEASR